MKKRVPDVSDATGTHLIKEIDPNRELNEQITALQATLETQGREHKIPCSLGALCPWCEITDLQARIKELEGQDYATSDYDNSLRRYYELICERSKHSDHPCTCGFEAALGGKP